MDQQDGFHFGLFIWMRVTLHIFIQAVQFSFPQGLVDFLAASEIQSSLKIISF